MPDRARAAECLVCRETAVFVEHITAARAGGAAARWPKIASGQKHPAGDDAGRWRSPSLRRGRLPYRGPGRQEGDAVGRENEKRGGHAIRQRRSGRLSRSARATWPRHTCCPARSAASAAPALPGALRRGGPPHAASPVTPHHGLPAVTTPLSAPHRARLGRPPARSILSPRKLPIKGAPDGRVPPLRSGQTLDRELPRQDRHLSGGRGRTGPSLRTWTGI